MPHFRGIVGQQAETLATWISEQFSAHPDTSVAVAPRCIISTYDYTCECCYRPSGPVRRSMYLNRYGPLEYIGIICEECARNVPACTCCGTRTLYSYLNQTSDVWPICYGCAQNAGPCPICAQNYRVLPGQTECRECGKGNTQRCEHCFTKNHPNALNCRKCGNRMGEADKPLTFNTVPIHRPVGVELEFLAKGLNADHVSGFGQLTQDGSVKWEGEHFYPKLPSPVGYRPHEFRVDPDVGDLFATNLRTITRHLMSAYGAVTNSTCGTHIHIFAGDLTGAEIENVTNWWRAHEFMFFRLVPSYRQKSSHARRVGALDDAFWKKDRYFALNQTALTKHGTLEFRLHHGTLDAERLIGWTNVCTHFVDRLRHQKITREQALGMARGGKRALLASFVRDVQLPPTTVKYIVDTARTYWTGRCGLLKPIPDDPIEKVLKEAPCAALGDGSVVSPCPEPMQPA